MMHADKWGPLGSVFATLCCVGAAPVVGALSAAGLGFVLNDVILLPLLVLFLGATIWGLHRDRARHGRAGPERLAAAGAVLTLGGLWISGAVVASGLALLVLGSLWNWRIIRGRRTAADAGGTS